LFPAIDQHDLWNVSIHLVGARLGYQLYSTLLQLFWIYDLARFSRWHPQLNDYNRLQAFGQAILEDGGQGLGMIWGFIDGSFVGFCRSIDSEHQRHMYFGYYKGHGMKWQATTTPDGLVSSLCGP
jgi:hypothetical protein